jgi:aspartate/methionine/tyrosine aminotransferase
MQEIIDMASSEDRKLWDNLRLGYTEPWGMPALREQIALSLYQGMNPENILCFAGAEEAIFAALSTICQPSDHAIVLTPCYQSLIEIPRSKGAEVASVLLREENDWRIDLSEIKKAIKPNTKCIIINFPHNPTGQVISQDELADLVALCDKHGIWLFSDEVYRLLGSPQEPWAKPAAEIYPKAVSLGVMSKAFGLAGLRVGWIACRDIKMLEKFKQMKDYLSICNSAPSEILTLIALKQKELILAQKNQIVAGNLALLDSFLLKYSNLFSWVRPEGGCVGFINYTGKESVDEFSKRLIQKKGVLLMPASVYDYPGNHFRVGFGRKNMPEALDKLEEFLEL